MKVTIDEASARLSTLIDAVLTGEDVVIVQGDTPVAKLIPIEKTDFKFGMLRGQLKGPSPDFLEPMDEDELAKWEGGA